MGGLPAAAQLAALRRRPRPRSVRLDGVPAWARDRGQPAAPGRRARRPPGRAAAAATARAVAGGSRPRRPPAGRSSCSCSTWPATGGPGASGDLDTADAVAVLVPGISNIAGGRPRRAGRGRPGRRPPRRAAAAPGLDRRDGRLAGLPHARPRLGRDRHPDRGAGAGGRALADCLAGLARRARRRPAHRTARTTVRGAQLRHAWWSTRPPTCPGGWPPTPWCCWAAPGWRTTPRASRRRRSSTPRRRTTRSRGSAGSATRDRRTRRSAPPGCPSTPAMGHSDYFDPDRPDAGRDRGGGGRSRGPRTDRSRRRPGVGEHGRAARRLSG